MYIKCMYLNTFVYIVLYIIYNPTLIKISKLGESWKLVSWENHGKGEELCVDKLVGWRSFSFLRTNRTEMSGPLQIQLA